MHAVDHKYYLILQVSRKFVPIGSKYNRYFVAVDDKGDAYAVIRKDKQQQPWIGIMDDGGGVAVLSANDQGGVLQIFESIGDDKDWKVVVQIDVNEDGDGQVVAHGNKGKTAAENP